MLGQNQNFVPGDLVFHPKSGFGTVQSLCQQERIQSEPQPAGDPAAELTEEYYEISLVQGGRLLVPVSRAASVGLRHLFYSLDSVTNELCSPPESLPADMRERSAFLRLCEQQKEPPALAHFVRDLLAASATRALSGAEEKWLARSCRQLSTEVALVEDIPFVEAMDAVSTIVHGLRLH